MTTDTRPARPRKRKNTGWVPDQHGAWAMVITPYVLGVALAHPVWAHLPLGVAWLSGYFAFFAAGLWLKAAPRRRGTYVRPLTVYGAVAVLGCFGVLAMTQSSVAQLLVAGACFVPLVAVAVYEAYRKRPRSVLSGVATTIASAGVLPVCLLVAGKPVLWGPTIILGLYFSSTIFYVKTLIRNRGQRQWLNYSIAVHLGCAIIALVLTLADVVHWSAIVFFLAATARAWWMPVSGEQRPKPWSPKQVGIQEIFWIIAASAVAVFSA